jgi:hypothetical protein
LETGIQRSPFFAQFLEVTNFMRNAEDDIVASLDSIDAVDAARIELLSDLDSKRSCVAYQQSDPAARVSNVNDRITLRRDEDIAKFKQGLRLAGLPE